MLRRIPVKQGCNISESEECSGNRNGFLECNSWKIRFEKKNRSKKELSRNLQH